MKLIDKATVIAKIEKIYEKYNKQRNSEYMSTADFICIELRKLLLSLNTFEVKEMDISSISENLAEADEYLSYTHTSNLSHNKPMIDARLRRVIKDLYNAGLFQLTHDKKYRLERLGLKVQKGE